MTRFLLLPVFAFCLLLTGGCSQSHNVAAPAADPVIDAFVRGYFDSWSKGDFSRYRGCFHPSATIDLKAEGQWLRWELKTFLDDQERMQSTAPRAQEIPTSIVIRARGEETAFVEIQWKLQRPTSSQETTGVDWFTLVKDGNQWKILHLTFWMDTPDKPKNAENSGSGALLPQRKVVVSGFEPFDNRSVNASSEFARAIKEQFPDDDIHFLQVPVQWGAPLISILGSQAWKPEIWIAFGEGDRDFRIETVADNRRVFARDNRQKWPPNEQIIPDGVPRRTLAESAASLHREIVKRGLNCRISTEAGNYLCEEMLYCLLMEQSMPTSTLRHSYFIHVPVHGKKTPIETVSAPFRGEHLKKAAKLMFESIVAHLQLIPPQ